MAFTWTIEVQDAITGTVKGTLTPDDYVVRLDSFEVFAGGDCGEANLTALAALVDIGSRDVIVISAQADGEPTPTERYRGVCVLTGSPEGVDPQRFRFAGLRSRYYELTTPLAVIAGADVAVMAGELLASITAAPAGVAGAESRPDTGFVLAARYPALESAGATLDALAETVGAFIVPAGETYEYDGHTYVAGDTVPAVRWGVNADGLVTFRRPPAASATPVSETSSAVVVRWRGISSERVVDRVRLVYAAGYVTEGLKSFTVAPGSWTNRAPGAGAAVPLARLFTSGDDYGSERVVPIEGPRDYMVEEHTHAFWTEMNDVANALDGDASTYATAAQVFEDPEIYLRHHDQPEAVIYVDVDLMTAAGVATLLLRTFPNTTGIIPASRAEYAIGPPDAGADTRFRGAFPLLVPAEVAGAAQVAEARLMVGDGQRVHQLDMLVPDVDAGLTASEKLASGYFVDVPPAVASIELLGVHDPVEGVTLTPASGAAALGLRIERTEWSISTERGATTTYHAGQPYGGDLMAHRAILDALAARAARKLERERIT